MIVYAGDYESMSETKPLAVSSGLGGEGKP